MGCAPCLGGERMCAAVRALPLWRVLVSVCCALTFARRLESPLRMSVRGDTMCTGRISFDTALLRLTFEFVVLIRDSECLVHLALAGLHDFWKCLSVFGYNLKRTLPSWSLEMFHTFMFPRLNVVFPSMMCCDAC